MGNHFNTLFLVGCQIDLTLERQKRCKALEETVCIKSSRPNLQIYQLAFAELLMRVTCELHSIMPKTNQSQPPRQMKKKKKNSPWKRDRLLLDFDGRTETKTDTVASDFHCLKQTLSQADVQINYS